MHTRSSMNKSILLLIFVSTSFPRLILAETTDIDGCSPNTTISSVAEDVTSKVIAPWGVTDIPDTSNTFAILNKDSRNYNIIYDQVLKSHYSKIPNEMPSKSALSALIKDDLLNAAKAASASGKATTLKKSGKIYITFANPFGPGRITIVTDGKILIDAFDPDLDNSKSKQAYGFESLSKIKQDDPNCTQVLNPDSNEPTFRIFNNPNAGNYSGEPMPLLPDLPAQSDNSTNSIFSAMNPINHDIVPILNSTEDAQTYKRLPPALGGAATNSGSYVSIPMFRR